MDLTRRLDVALESARLAGDVIMRHFRDRSFAVERKQDGTDVTNADREAEVTIVEHLSRAFPEDGFWGEEHGQQPGTSGNRWIIDPIDGTTSFIHGVPLFGTLIAMEREGRSLIGVIMLPALNEVVYASEGGGAWHDWQGRVVRAEVSGTTSVREAMVLTTSADYFRKADRLRALESIGEVAGQTRGWSDCYAHVLVATGRADAVVEPVLSPWDVAPMPVIMREAGGLYTSWEGEETAHAPEGLSTNGQIHESLLETIRSAVHVASE